MYARNFKTIAIFFSLILLNAVCPLFILNRYPDLITMIFVTISISVAALTVYFLLTRKINNLFRDLDDQKTALKELSEDNARMIEQLNSKSERALKQLHRIQELEEKQEAAYKKGYEAGREDEKAAFMESLNTLTQKIMMCPESFSGAVAGILRETVQRSAS